MGGAGYVRIEVRGGSAERREWAAAEAFAAGAQGAEEGEQGLSLYAAAGAVEAVLAALAPFGDLAIEGPEPVPDEPWPETWREGLEAIVVSDELVVRPSFAPAPVGFRGSELVIEPGQAFGTGAHASTRLALDLLVALPRAQRAGRRVLDVGCGSGVLALAAVALGAARAIAFDLDPRGALAGPPFDLVLANLLRRELEPLLAGVTARLRPGGRLLVAGLLASEGPAIEARLAALGLAVDARREIADADGERWLGLGATATRSHSKGGR